MKPKTLKQIGTRRWALEAKGDAAREIPVYLVPAGRSADETANALGLQILRFGAGSVNDVVAIISDLSSEWRAVPD